MNGFPVPGSTGTRLERRDILLVERGITERWPQHVAESWEDLVRATLPALRLHGKRWATGAPWWGHLDGGELAEIDVVAPSSDDPGLVLAGEVKLRASEGEVKRALSSLEAKIARCPALRRFRVERALFVLEGIRRSRSDVVPGATWWSAVKRAATPKRPRYALYSLLRDDPRAAAHF